MTQDVYILSAARTAIGTFGGSLTDLSPTKLGTVATVPSFVGERSVRLPPNVPIAVRAALRM